MRTLFVVLCFLLIAPVAYAQSIGTCDWAEADAYLDNGSLRVRVFNNGMHYFSGSPHVLELASHPGAQASFTANLWVGGMVEDELRVTGSTYRASYWPGPLDASGLPPDDCVPYDTLYALTSDDLRRFVNERHVSDNLRDWPAHLGAPVVDGDGDPANYNLLGGDLPELLGDQMLWWVMNDRGNATTYGPPHQTEPTVGLSVQGSAFMYDVPGVIGTTVFYQYRVKYHETAPLENAFVGLYVDDDLGSFIDDYTGVDTVAQFGYTYNVDNDDDDGFGGFGENPPAIAHILLRGATDAEGNDQGLSRFVCVFKSGGPYGEPGLPEETYNILQGRWKNGDPMIANGDGTPRYDGPETYFCYPGRAEDGAFWSQRNMDGQGQQNGLGDKRYAFSSGPVRIQPGEEQTFVFATMVAFGDDHLDAIRTLRREVGHLQSVKDQILAPFDWSIFQPEKPPFEPGTPRWLYEAYPNPFTDQATIPYSIAKPQHVRLSVYDLLGREVARLVDAPLDTGTYSASLDGAHLAPGVYVYHLTGSASRPFTRRIVRL